MTRRTPHGWLRLAAFAALGACAACGATAPAVTVVTPLPRGEDPSIVVIAARQREAVITALTAAGFRIAERVQESPYLLRVTLGVDQGSRACGTLNNVRYALRRDQQTIVEVSAKGWTGTCVPSVFNDASRALRASVVAMTGATGGSE